MRAAASLLSACANALRTLSAALRRKADSCANAKSGSSASTAAPGWVGKGSGWLIAISMACSAAAVCVGSGKASLMAISVLMGVSAWAVVMGVASGAAASVVAAAGAVSDQAVDCTRVKSMGCAAACSGTVAMRVWAARICGRASVVAVWAAAARATVIGSALGSKGWALASTAAEGAAGCITGISER